MSPPAAAGGLLFGSTGNEPCRTRKSAEKSLRQDEKRRLRNRAAKKAIKSADQDVHCRRSARDDAADRIQGRDPQARQGGREAGDPPERGGPEEIATRPDAGGEKIIDRYAIRGLTAADPLSAICGVSLGDRIETAGRRHTSHDLRRSARTNRPILGI